MANHETFRSRPTWRQRWRQAVQSVEAGKGWWIGALLFVPLMIFTDFGAYEPRWVRSSAQPMRSVWPAGALPEYMQYRHDPRDLLSQTLPPLLPTRATPPPPPPPAAPTGRFLNRAEIQAIQDAIDGELPHVKAGSYKVAFMVSLDERGAIRTLIRKTSSGLLALDLRVEEAIRAAAPFRPEVKRQFGLEFTQQYGRAKRAAPAASEPLTAAPPLH